MCYVSYQGQKDDDDVDEDDDDDDDDDVHDDDDDDDVHDDDDVDNDNDEYNLMRLDTAGVERNPPFPTINFDTLFAAAILL